MEAGFTEGFDEDELNPEGELDHEYVLPVTAAAPIEIELPEQMLVLEITAAAGNALTVMVTELDLVQPVAVTVSVSV